MIGAAIAGQLSGLEASLADSARSAVGERDARLADESLRQEVAAYAMKEACYHELLKRIDLRRANARPGVGYQAGRHGPKKARYDLEMRIAGTHGLGQRALSRRGPRRRPAPGSAPTRSRAAPRRFS